MTRSDVTENMLGQAVYTWSDKFGGSVTFTAFSPALEHLKEWLIAQKWPEFTAQSPWACYAPTQTVSLKSVGRTRRDSCGIVYYKSIGYRLDSKRRPTVFVHAIIGNADILPMTLIDEIPDSLWLSDDTDVTRPLPDLLAKDLVKQNHPIDLEFQPELIAELLDATDNPWILSIREGTQMSNLAAVVPEQLLPWVNVDKFIKNGQSTRLLWLSDGPPEGASQVLREKKWPPVAGLLEAMTTNPESMIAAQCIRITGGHAVPLTDEQAAHVALLLSNIGVSLVDFANLSADLSIQVFGGWDGSHLDVWEKLGETLLFIDLVALWEQNPSPMLLGVLLMRIHESTSEIDWRHVIDLEEADPLMMKTLDAVKSRRGGKELLKRAEEVGLLRHSAKSTCDGRSVLSEVPHDALCGITDDWETWEAWCSAHSVPLVEAAALWSRLQPTWWTRIESGFRRMLPHWSSTGSSDDDLLQPEE